jgi:acyl-CoA synthetase (AMP-forming)/AMP-acid ligase II
LIAAALSPERLLPERRRHLAGAFFAPGGPGDGVILSAGCRIPEGADRRARAVPSEVESARLEVPAAHTSPREVEPVDELPKTLIGKIRRTELRERGHDG